MAQSGPLERAVSSYALYVALGVVVGVVVAPAFAGTVAPDRDDGVVAVIPVQGQIDGTTAAEVSAMLAEARANESIDAVVLSVNSGGGGAAASEEMYFAVKRATEGSDVPVMASVDAAAASGAYYTIAPADEIYVKPASTIGSVGVLANLPNSVEPNDVVGASGPNKLSGSDQREFLYILDSLQTAFGNAVIEQRGDALELSRSELLQARIYSGGQAVQNGLADEIGDRESAVRAAAEAAELESYSVRVLRPNNDSVTFVSRSAYLASEASSKRLISADRLFGNGTGGPTFLMVGSVYLGDGDRVVSANAVERARNETTPTDSEPSAASTTRSPTPNGTATDDGTAGTATDGQAAVRPPPVADPSDSLIDRSGSLVDPSDSLIDRSVRAGQSAAAGAVTPPVGVTDRAGVIDGPTAADAVRVRRGGLA